MKVRKFKTNHIYTGDCLEVMKDFPEGSVDLIVTDCPYGIAFMEKGWDKVLPSVAIWKQCLRVLKPGAFAFIMSAPRQDVLARMIINLEDAGFVVGFSSIYWVYASGFPKATNISKAVDKKLGYDEERGYIKPTGGLHGGTGNTVGRFTGRQLSNKSFSKQAKALDGTYAGFQPKPALEVVLVCMKPIDCGSYTEQAMKNGKGCTWLDDGRIPSGGHIVKGGGDKGWNVIAKNEINEYRDGRFPANILCENDVLNDGKVYETHSTGQHDLSDYGIRGNIFRGKHKGKYGSDSGSFSRHFSLDAWWDGLIKQLPKSVQKTFPFMTVPKASVGEKNDGLGKFPSRKKWNKSGGGTGITARENIISRNFHPTCKPIKLGCYLVTIGSREGDVVLDPFCGSGSFCISALMMGRKHIGIDTESEYIKIAKGRIREKYLEMITR